MRFVQALLAVALFSGCPSTQVAKAPPLRGTLLITNVRVFDGESVISKTSVLVDGDQIAAIGVGLGAPSGAEVIDGSGKTLLPGFIDSHTHAHHGQHLRQALAFGVTTELDMMRPKGARAQRRSNPVDEASLFSAGNVVTVAGGHGTQFRNPVPIPTIESGEDVDAFVTARVNEGSDYIKIMIENGTSRGIEMPTLTEEMVAAAVASAHRHKVLAVAHATTHWAARVALRARVDVLVHSFLGGPNEDVRERMRKQGTAMVPTLSVVFSVCGAARGKSLAANNNVAPYLSKRSKRVLTAAIPFPGDRPKCSSFTDIVRDLHGAGVPILAGTDAPNAGTAHGASFHDELALLVEAGLTPREALAAATSIPARVFRLADRGRIAKGHRADLLLVRGDPTKDIAATANIVGIWKGGVRLDRAGYAKAIAAENARP